MLIPVRLASTGGRVMRAAITAGLLAGMAACGSVAAGPASHAGPAGSGSGAPGNVPLCANARHLDRLVVSLVALPKSASVHQALPVAVTIRDPARVRAVAGALCGLPAMTHAAVPCPVGTGGYRLTFSAAGQSYAPVVVKASGCRSVSGLGPARTTSGSFWTLLRTELSGSTATGAAGAPVAP